MGWVYSMVRVMLHGVGVQYGEGDVTWGGCTVRGDVTWGGCTVW